jgi:hypothetical protein
MKAITTELQQYINGVQAPDGTTEWVLRRVPDEYNVQEVEHIIDYFCSGKATRFERMMYIEANNNAKKWTKTLIKNWEHIKETEQDTKIILDFKDGFKIVQLVGKNAYEREGYLMRHCVASYYGKDVKIYSLRDKNNIPHCTIEQDSQIKGKGNGHIHPKYIGYVVNFLEYTGMKVRDSEMKNLGYYNVEKYKKYLSKDTIANLFNKKYWYRSGCRLVDKNGNDFYSLNMLDDIPLIEETKTGLTINFNLQSFIRLSIDFLYKTIKKLGTLQQERNAWNGLYISQRW